jgi:Icc protein
LVFKEMTMPFHLSRRGFLQQALATSTSAWAFRSAVGAGRDVDPDLFALLNDSHVSENTARAPNGQNISDNLRHAVNYLLGLPRYPAAVLINGDLAHNHGLRGDYQQFNALIEPLVAAGMEVHLTLGNHDDREVFFEVLTEHRASQSPVASKHVAVVQGPRANFFLLDSLKVVNQAAGELGEEQLGWLTEALAQHADRPAILVVHHDPQFIANGPEAKFTWSGLTDAKSLFEQVLPRQQVKAYVHGHIHRWGLQEKDGLHIVNTPAIGYVAQDGPATTGWTMCRLRDDGARLTTYTVNGAHPWHNQSHDLVWRS